MSRSLRDWAFGRRGLEWSQRVYDWWSSHDWAYTLFVNGFLFGRETTFRKRTVATLDLQAGDSVLDVGCGHGRNFRHIATALDSKGQIVGVDASQGMVERASRRAETVDCDLDVVLADATRLPMCGEGFDAAIATLSLSAMTDVESTLERVYDVLRPGGRLAILDTRSFQSAPGRWVNPLVESVSAYLTNWYPESDVVGTAEATFDDTTITSSHGGTVYVISARKRGSEGSDN